MVDWENASKAVEKVTVRTMTAKLMMMTMTMLLQRTYLMVVDGNFILIETL